MMVEAAPQTVASQEPSKACKHEIAWPSGRTGSTKAPPDVTDLAHSFPFQLDPFQKVSIASLEAGDSVLVAAHTSAGKTVVAQYGIAMALRDKTRVIYTSPLKALSNQKYKEFLEEFTDVGLMTGDITINPDASCLVITTEILRSMLYHCSEVIAEARLIIFDEIHYIRDRERGVVWEESIILLPRGCQCAFLSATIPNAFEFAQWIATIRDSKCHVVYTDYRPVPLQHFVMPCGGEKAPLYCVVDKAGRFQEASFAKAIAAVGDGNSHKKGQDTSVQKKTDSGESSDIYQLTQLLIERDLQPVIVFALSKRQCEQLASNLVHMTVNSTEEMKLVDAVFWSAMDILPPQDRALPQVVNALPMLRRGIGVHHSGLLPIVKEAVEVLFAEGLIKVLFATETFSTGLNMPAHTVVFAGIRKFDGHSFRNLSGAEYIQMSGRAGRRGLDDTGTVILMCDSKLEPSDAKSIVKGHPEPLYSAFHLEYSSLLSMLRIDQSGTLAPERLVRHSLLQFQAEAQLPKLEALLSDVSAEMKIVEPAVTEDAKELYHLLLERSTLLHQTHQIETLPKYSIPFLKPGRLARIAVTETKVVKGEPDDDARRKKFTVPGPPTDSELPTGEVRSVWAAIVSFQRVQNKADDGASEKLSVDPDGGPGIVSDAQCALESAYIVDVLACVMPKPPGSGHQWIEKRDLLAHDDSSGIPMVVTVPLSQITGLSTARVMLPITIRVQEDRESGLRVIREAVKRLHAKYNGDVPLLDSVSDLKISSSRFKKLQSKLRKLDGMLHSNPLFRHEDQKEGLKTVMHCDRLKSTHADLSDKIRSAKGLVLKHELEQRLRVLRHLGYMDASGTVLKKGHVAAVISTANALVLTELLMHGALSTLTAIQTVSILSCFVWSEPSDRGNSKIREELQGPYAALRESAKRVATVEADAGLIRDVETFVNSFRPDFMDMVTLWASGGKFAEVKQLGKSIFEGSIVRAIRRLYELLGQLTSACEILGDTTLSTKIGEGAEKLKRDVVFAASLYL